MAFTNESYWEEPPVATQAPQQRADISALPDPSEQAGLSKVGVVPGYADTIDSSGYKYNTANQYSDSDALYKAMFVAGLNMLANPNADIGSSLAQGISKGAEAWSDALNRNARYENIGELEKRGYTPESIDLYVSSGDVKMLSKKQSDMENLGGGKFLNKATGAIYQMEEPVKPILGEPQYMPGSRDKYRKPLLNPMTREPLRDANNNIRYEYGSDRPAEPRQATGGSKGPSVQTTLAVNSATGEQVLQHMFPGTGVMTTDMSGREIDEEGNLTGRVIYNGGIYNSKGEPQLLVQRPQAQPQVAQNAPVSTPTQSYDIPAMLSPTGQQTVYTAPQAPTQAPVRQQRPTFVSPETYNKKLEAQQAFKDEYAEKLSKTDRALRQLETTMAQPGFTSLGGQLGARTMNLSQAAQEAQAYVDADLGNVFGFAYETLKGGGPITDIEGNKKTNAILAAFDKDGNIKPGVDLQTAYRNARYVLTLDRTLQEATYEKGRKLDPEEARYYQRMVDKQFDSGSALEEAKAGFQQPTGIKQTRNGASWQIVPQR